MSSVLCNFVRFLGQNLWKNGLFFDKIAKSLSFRDLGGLDFDDNLAVERTERRKIAGKSFGVGVEDGAARGQRKINDIASIIA